VHCEVVRDAGGGGGEVVVVVVGCGLVGLWR